MPSPCPAHESWVYLSGKPPLALPNDAPDGFRQITTVEVANRAGFKHWDYPTGALDAAMYALRIAVVKMRAHDAKRQVSLHTYIELRSAKPVAERPLTGDEQGAAKERSYRRSCNGKPCRVPDARRQLQLWKGIEFVRYDFSDERHVLGGKPWSRACPIRHDPQPIEVHTLRSEVQQGRPGSASNPASLRLRTCHSPCRL